MKPKKVRALLAPAVSSLGVAAAVLISDPDKISQVSPFLPVMTVNGASIVAAIAAEDVPDTKVGAVLRPCELRAVVELIKLQQVSRENVF
ncbi:MAG: formate dehydrogenase, partial [candidate division WOR-3 bacterium]